MMTKVKTQGLVSDLMPNIKLMQAVGHFLFNYHSENAGMSVLLRKVYSSVHAVLIVAHYLCMAVNMAKYSEEVNELTANTITVLFFAHSLIKLLFFAVTSKNFYRTLAVWNQSNSHPLFTESDARYHQLALTKMRRLLYFICGTTIFSVTAWVTITFFGDSVRFLVDKETNETLTEEVPRLPLKAWYPFNAMSGTMYIAAFAFQIYWLLFSMAIANLLDVMFCSWLIFACEQLQHLKAIMKPLMELSASLDTYRPNTAELFKVNSSEKSPITEKIPDPIDMDIRGIYSTQQDFGMTLRGAGGRLQTFGQNPNNPNGLSQKQEMLARSAIKYWVERHKHIVRLVSSIGDTYGTALLFHMLVSTITLTLLAYQATKINGLNVYAFTTIGYLSYTLGQVFHFCIFGNRLIEESSSVMEAAYSCQWYDGSEEAKTFVQIVCQQCQKAMSISGAKFFTVSLDLFASVLGAVVTYFMVLVQLK
ncbi:odorant receptor coreceptor [Maniola hyperantus]|uniref:odorant receptor coreceptor n=1 Tax=Aphantopus hyperantus TaxID=2795564 RepID=UPI001569359E|nr:odorant receptor coreceptor [Maniola hyperantus]